MNFRILFLAVFSCLYFEVVAADPLLLSHFPESTRLTDTPAEYLDKNFRDIGQAMNSDQWKLVKDLSAPLTSNCSWIRFSVLNDFKEKTFLDLNFKSADSIEVFVIENGSYHRLLTGPYTNVDNWLTNEDPGIVPVPLGPGKTYPVYARLWSDKGRPFALQNVFLQKHEYTLENTVKGYREYIGRVEFNGFFLGAVIFAMLFFLFIFFKVRERVFLLYSFYLLGAALYSVIVKTLPYSYLARTIYLDYPLSYKLGEPIQFFFFATYISFGKALLTIDRKYPWLNRVIQVFVGALLIAGVLLSFFNFTSFDYLFQQKVFVWSRIIILPAVFALLVAIGIKVQSKLKWFFLLGSFFFFAGGLLAVASDPKSRHLFFGEIPLNPAVLFKSGILLECLCFALALGYKLRQARLEKEASARAYIEQLELNRKMVVSENERLEKIVAERTASILKKNRLIEEQKQIQQQSVFEKKLAEMEMRALRSQMSPHFIFNSLNSIRYQILKKDYEGAAKYLTSFSKLLRYILQNSREHVVTLAEEIEINRLYVQIESLRFDQGLDFVIDVGCGVDMSEIMVPPMLLQPYVENAVKHGLIPSKKPTKKLLVSVNEVSNGFSIIIEDNGIGRKASGKHTLLEGQQSLGMRIASERIDLFNNHFHPRIDVTIIDLYTDDRAQGTRVVVNYQENL